VLETDPRVADALERILPTYSDESGDWSAVVRRARPPRRRVALVAIAAGGAALLAAPGLGLGGRLLDLLERPSAPPEVQSYFAADDAMRQQLFAHAAEAGSALHDRFSPVIADEARGVFAIASPDGPIYLWAAPTEDGRQCSLIQEGADVATGRPHGAGFCDDPEPRAAIAPATFWTAERPSVWIVHARVYDDAVTRVDVEVAGAADLSLPVVAGHALGTVPKDATVEAFVGRDADGAVVARVGHQAG
jgi:hypothetical protein